jgi:hypothetical protein
MSIRSLFGHKHEEFSKVKKLSTPLHVQLSQSGLFDSQDDVNDNFNTLVEYLDDWLNTQGFEREQILLEFMLEKKEGGFRKDGKTPSALHEVSQALYFTSCIEDNLYHNDPAGVLATILSHDLKEDFKVSRNEIKNRLIENGIAYDDDMSRFLDDFDTISYHSGDKHKPDFKNKYHYSLELRRRENASMAKLFDNTHNSATSVGGLENSTLLKHKDKIMNNVSLFAGIVTNGDQEEALEIAEVIREALKNEEYSKVNDYTSKIQLNLNQYVGDSSKHHPHNADMYHTLEKVIGKTVQINRHLFYNESDREPYQPLDLEESDFPEKGFKIPRGLHPYHMARDRVIERRPEVAPKDYEPPKGSFNFSDDNNVQPV